MFWKKNKLILSAFLFNAMLFGQEPSLTVQVLEAKYFFPQPQTPGRVVQLINQSLSTSWLHALWAQTSKNYYPDPELPTLSRAAVSRSADAPARWWEADTKWVNDCEVQMGLIRLLSDPTSVLAQEFVNYQYKIIRVEERDKLFKASKGEGCLKDEFFYKYVGNILKFLGNKKRKGRLKLLQDSNACPELYWEVLKSLPKATNIAIDNCPEELAAVLYHFQGSILSFFTYMFDFDAKLWFKLLKNEISEICFRVRVDKEHWVLLALNNDGAGSILATWYESRTNTKHRFFNDFEAVIIGALHQAKTGEENWEKLCHKLANRNNCFFKIFDYEVVSLEGKTMVKLIIDYSPESSNTIDSISMNQLAIKYISPQDLVLFLSQYNVYFLRETCDGFAPISHTFGKFINLQVECGGNYGVHAKLESDKRKIDKFNYENWYRTGACGQPFTAIRSKQSMYFPTIGEFLSSLKPFVFTNLRSPLPGT